VACLGLELPAAGFFGHLAGDRHRAVEDASIVHRDAREAEGHGQVVGNARELHQSCVRGAVDAGRTLANSALGHLNAGRGRLAQFIRRRDAIRLKRHSNGDVFGNLSILVHYHVGRLSQIRIAHRNRWNFYRRSEGKCLRDLGALLEGDKTHASGVLDLTVKDDRIDVLDRYAYTLGLIACRRHERGIGNTRFFNLEWY